MGAKPMQGFCPNTIGRGGSEEQVASSLDVDAVVAHPTSTEVELKAVLELPPLELHPTMHLQVLPLLA